MLIRRIFVYSSSFNDDVLEIRIFAQSITTKQNNVKYTVYST